MTERHGFAVGRCATLAEVIDRAADTFGEKTLTFPANHDSLTFAELAERAGRVAGALREQGVRKGDRVGFILPNDASFLVSFIGIGFAGAVPAPLPTPTSVSGVLSFLQRLGHVLRDAGIQHLILSGPFADTFSSLAASGELKELAQSLRPLVYGDLVAAGGRRGDAGIGPEDLGLVQYTSGSTTAPKGVALRHRNLVAALDAIGSGIRLGPSDINGQWLPLFHDMGLIGTLTGLAHGVSQMIWPPTTFVRNPGRWLRDFARNRCSIYAGPSFSYGYMTDHVPAEDVPKLDLSAWRIAFNGAEPIDPDILDRFSRHFAPAGFKAETMFPVYGMAEVTLAVTFPRIGEKPLVKWVDRAELADQRRVVFLPEDDPRARRVVAVGSPIAGHEVRVVEPDGAVLPHERVGEIEVRGPAVMAGYFSLEAGEPRFPSSSDWLPTGDLGFLSGEQLYVTGRMKQMLIVRGQNYYPEDIEAIVRDIPGVRRGRNIAISAGDSRAPGVAVLAETSLAAEEELAPLLGRIDTNVFDQLGLRLANIHLVRPRSIQRTPNGKYQRLSMSHRLQSGELRREILASLRGSHPNAEVQETQDA